MPPSCRSGQTGRTVYILDEPTTGLHFEDIRKLLGVLGQAWSRGATRVIVIEHNLDVIKTADWLIDMGPEGGSGGGRVVAEGTPEEVALVAASHTGGFLRDILTDRLPSGTAAGTPRGAAVVKAEATRAKPAAKAPAAKAAAKAPAGGPKKGSAAEAPAAPARIRTPRKAAARV